jgi:hypothetical protein
VLPSRALYGDYYALTANPIVSLIPHHAWTNLADRRLVLHNQQSLQEIKKKVTRGSYASIHDFKADFTLMCNNSKAYNASESIVYEDAVSLQVSARPAVSGDPRPDQNYLF